MKKVDKIKAIVDTVTFDPFHVTIEGLGTFAHKPFWWAELREDKPLLNLQREIEHKLALCRFEMDGREYHPHTPLDVRLLPAASHGKLSHSAKR